MLAIAVLVVISNQDRLSPRVRRAIPARPLKRLVAFLFYNGAAGGLVWAMLLTVLTYIMLMLFPSSRAPAYNSRPGYAFSAELYYGAFYLYVFAYALTGLAIQRRFFARRPAKLAGLIAVFIPIALMIVPLIIRFFFNRLTWGWVEGEQLGNLFNLMGHADDGDATSNHFFCALVWLVIAVAFNLKWFTQQGRRFQPLDHAESISPSL